MALNKEDILKHTGSVKRREVHIPAWANAQGDDVVLVRGLTSAEWDAHSSMLQAAKDGSNASAKLLSRCIINSDGSRIFTAQDVAMIGELPVAEITKLGAAVAELSGLTEEAQAEVEGNSGAAPSGSSGSDSPETSSTAP